jgi:hypothetical protein
MSIEPRANRRLRLVCATTRDPELLNDLRQVLEEDPMSFVPSADLLRDIALCAACTQDSSRKARAGLCDAHRARWNLQSCLDQSAESDVEDESLQHLLHGVLTSPDGGAQLLSAFDRQRRALRMVLDAHACGAVRLPESVAASVERACDTGPRFLVSGSRAASHGASYEQSKRMRS